MYGMGTLHRRQFQLGVTAQEICADNNFKGVGVKHFAVLGHRLIAQTYGHIDPRREWMVLPSPTLIATVSVFRIIICFRNLRAAMESVTPVCKTAL